MKLIGLSLSLCVSAVLRGAVNEKSVQKIITSTRCANTQEWQNAIDSYKESYWGDDPERAEEIAWRLIRSGKIIQPRLGEDLGDLNGKIPLLPDGTVHLATFGNAHWLDAETFKPLTL